VTVEAAYTTWSATYDADRNLTRDLDQDVTRRVLGDRHFRSVLEIGCGTGKNTALLAGIAERVVALDFSEGMLARARAKMRADHVVFLRTDVTRPWPCADGSVDLVIGNLVLEHIEHLDAVFAEASRCLTADGRLFVSELHPFRQYQGAQARFVDAANESTRVPAFVHHVSEVLDAATRAGVTLLRFGEWWHDEDASRPPRLATFELVKR
jgi:malonyl-CoA O-methyltransferase